jgi:hypothetical protein
MRPPARTLLLFETVLLLQRQIAGMKTTLYLTLALALSCSGLLAQKEDIKDAGRSTKKAAEKTGKKVAKGTKKAANKTADKVGDAADKVKDKTK